MTFVPSDYGEMKLTDNGTATTISSQNSWVKITGFSEGQTGGVTVSNSDLVVDQRGNYYIDASGAATPASTNTDFEFGIFTNDSLV